MACEYRNLPRNRSKIVFTDSAPSYCTVGEVYGVGYSRHPRSGYVGEVSLSSDKGMTHVSAYLFDLIGWGVEIRRCRRFAETRARLRSAMPHCRKCDADISDTYERADPSVGMMSGGWYCQDCDLALADWETEREPMPGDVPISFAREPGEPLGTPMSELASQPGKTPEQRAKYENFVRIARSWGYD